MKRFLLLMMLNYVCLSFSGGKNNQSLTSQNNSQFINLECNVDIEGKDSSNFVFFFKQIIEDEVLRNKSFSTLDSDLKIIFINRLNQLEDAFVYRNEIMDTDSLVWGIFYDDSLTFYKAKFMLYEDEWYLKSMEKDHHLGIPVLSDLKRHKDGIVYKPNCIDKKFIGIIDPYGEKDTFYNGNNVLTYAFSNTFLFYNESRELPSDFQYEMEGLGSGVGGYAEFKNNCLFRYWDASN